MNLVQIGTNQGHDDFTNLVKKLDKNEIKKLILVEPLESCNQQIKSCYSGYDFILENLVINVDPSIKKEKFFVSKYNWLSSLKKSHIEKHKTNEVPLEVEVDCMTLNELFDKHEITHLDILFIDSEGLDDELIMSIDFSRFYIEKIYYEDFHIDNQNLIKFLNENGYSVDKSDFRDNLTSIATKTKV
jgi:FkbM family methyltransferase